MSKYLLLLSALFLFATACDKTEVVPDEPEQEEQQEEEKQEEEKEEEKETCGCTDQLAVNFNDEVSCDNGSCVYIDDDKKTLNTLFTSTGCGACGIWGIDCHKDYSKEALDKAIPFELHFKYGDSMINETSDSFVAIARPRYSPFFAVGLKESMGGGSDRPTICVNSHKNADEMIDQFITEAPASQLGITHTIKDGRIEAHFAVEMSEFENVKYAIYVLEDGLVYVQNAGWKNDIPGWVHNNTVRDAITPVLGTPLKTDKASGSISLELDPEWNPDNLYTVLVLWDDTKGLPTVVNAETSKR